MGSRAGTDEDNAFQIGRLAEETGISASAIRFYERRGLISPPARVSGRRLYDRSAIQRLAVIQLCARAGFSVAEIRTLLTASRKRRTELAHDKRAELESSLKTARRAQRMLDEFIACGCEDLVNCVKASTKKGG